MMNRTSSCENLKKTKKIKGKKKKEGKDTANLQEKTLGTKSPTFILRHVKGDPITLKQTVSFLPRKRKEGIAAVMRSG